MDLVNLCKSTSAALLLKTFKASSKSSLLGPSAGFEGDGTLAYQEKPAFFKSAFAELSSITLLCLFFG